MVWCYLQGSDVDKDKTMNLQPMFQQRLPPNTRVLLLADLGEDDSCTLVLGFTDRMVRAYRWIDSGQVRSLNSGCSQVLVWDFETNVWKCFFHPLLYPELIFFGTL